MSPSAVCGPAVAETSGVPERSWNANDFHDMLALARHSYRAWQGARGRSAAERHAAQLLAFAFGRIDDLAVLDEADRG
jgi:hypothetical protein